MRHKDIQIIFTIDGRRYEAVGFLNEGELSVNGNTMLSRTAGRNGGAIGREEERFLNKRFSEFPTELRHYYLALGGRNPNNPRSIACFDWHNSWWYQRWGDLDRQWGPHALVLRRCM